MRDAKLIYFDFFTFFISFILCRYSVAYEYGAKGETRNIFTRMQIHTHGYSCLYVHRCVYLAFARKCLFVLAHKSLSRCQRAHERARPHGWAAGGGLGVLLRVCQPCMHVCVCVNVGV